MLTEVPSSRPLGFSSLRGGGRGIRHFTKDSSNGAGGYNVQKSHIDFGGVFESERRCIMNRTGLLD
jgi:hypothetical protein